MGIKMMDFETCRKAMIDSQLRTCGINEDFVLDRMIAVPREDFVPAAQRACAYIDRSVALDNGRRIAAPVVYGKLLAASRPAEDDRALVIDAGSGYLPALIRPLVAEMDVLSVEDTLALTTSKGGKGKGYSLIIIDGALEHAPESLLQKLQAGGRIIMGLCADRGITQLVRGEKGEAVKSPNFVVLAEVAIPRLHEFDQAKEWKFT